MNPLRHLKRAGEIAVKVTTAPVTKTHAKIEELRDLRAGYNANVKPMQNMMKENLRQTGHKIREDKKKTAEKTDHSLEMPVNLISE